MNDIRSVTVCRMEVPCCGGLQRAAEGALDASGKKLPFEVVTFSVRGEVLEGHASIGESWQACLRVPLAS